MSGRCGGLWERHAGQLVTVVMFVISVGVPAAASGQGSGPTDTASQWEVGVAATGLGAIPLGSASANLTTPGGAALPVFEAASRLAPGLGVEFQISRALSGRVHLMGLAAWTRTDIETDITGDAEGVADVRLVNHASRVSAEGAVAITVATWATHSLYVLGGGGWMRELPGGVVFGANGGVGKLGAGVKYWWRRPQPGPSRSTPARPRRVRAIGLRVEARAVARYPGVVIGVPRVRVAPGLLAGLIFGL